LVGIKTRVKIFIFLVEAYPIVLKSNVFKHAGIGKVVNHKAHPVFFQQSQGALPERDWFASVLEDRLQIAIGNLPGFFNKIDDAGINVL